MNDLVLWFNEKTLDLLLVENFNVDAAQEQAIRLERNVWISAKAVTINAGAPEWNSQRSPIDVATPTIEWPDFLAGLDLIGDPVLQEKLASSYLASVLRVVLEDRRHFIPDRLCLILPVATTDAAGRALRQGMLAHYTTAKAIYAIRQDVLIGIGLAQALTNKNRLQESGEPLQVAALVARDQIMFAEVSSAADEVHWQFCGRRGVEMQNDTLPSELLQAIDLVFIDSSLTGDIAVEKIAAGCAIEPVSWQIIMRYGLTTLLNPADALNLEISALPAWGVGFAEGERMPLTLPLHQPFVFSYSEYFAFVVSAESAMNSMNLTIFADCLGGLQAGRAAGAFVIPTNKSVAAAQTPTELVFCIGVSAYADSRFEVRVHERLGLRTLTKSQFDLPGLMY